MGDRQDHSGRDFFVSYTSADRRWAQWIGWQLKQDGYEVNTEALARAVTRMRIEAPGLR